MHRDTQEALNRLEAELLAEDADDVQTEAALVRGCKAYNADRTDEDPETYSRELLKPDRSERRLVVLAALLALGILLVALYWLIRLRGAL